MQIHVLAARGRLRGCVCSLCPRLKVILSPAALISNLSRLCLPGKLPKSPQKVWPGSGLETVITVKCHAWEINSHWRPRPWVETDSPTGSLLPQGYTAAPRWASGWGPHFCARSSFSCCEPRARPLASRAGGQGGLVVGAGGGRGQAWHCAESRRCGLPFVGSCARYLRFESIGRRIWSWLVQA